MVSDEERATRNARMRAYRSSPKGRAAKARAVKRKTQTRLAHHVVAGLVSRGILLKPTDCVCATCGEPAAGYWHHHGIGPLQMRDVAALCAPCLETARAKDRKARRQGSYAEGLAESPEHKDARSSAFLGAYDAAVALVARQEGEDPIPPGFDLRQRVEAITRVIPEFASNLAPLLIGEPAEDWH